MSSLHQEAYDAEFSPTMKSYRENETGEREGRWYAEYHPEWWCGTCGCFIGIPGVPCDCENARTSDPNIGRFQ